MKRWIIYVLLGFTFYSCEDGYLDKISNIDPCIPQTRVSSAINNFDPVAEVDGVLVNIINEGNSVNPYLSVSDKGSSVSLVSSDDDSGRQQWEMSGNGLFEIVRGHNNVDSNPKTHLILIPNDLYNPQYPILSNWLELDEPFASYNSGLHMMYGQDGTCISRVVALNSNPFDVRYLSSSSSTSSNLTFSVEPITQLSKWRIVPIGEFEIVDMQYILTSTDDLQVRDVLCGREEYSNDRSVPVTWDYTINTSFKQSSSFSTSDGVSVSFTQNVQIGLPDVLETGTNVTVGYTFQQNQSNQVTFVESNEKNISLSRTVHVEVAPYSVTRIDAVLTTYSGSLTYVATVRNINDGKTFRIKGKWHGSLYSTFVGKTYDVTTGQLLDTFSLE